MATNSLDAVLAQYEKSTQNSAASGSKMSSEDRMKKSFAALLKDNLIYKEEQNTVYVVTTLTMATLLVAAILVSK